MTPSPTDAGAERGPQAGTVTAPRIFTVPASAPFLPTLADALLDGRLIAGFAPRGDPLALATATVYLPTRRAGRLFADALVAAMPERAALLPRIVPLGDVDEDALAFAEESVEPPAPVAATTRRLALASLVERWRGLLAADDPRATVADGPGAGLTLADALAHIVDEMAAFEVPWSRLDDLVPGEHDRYWDMALDFLKIARTAWPALLDEIGAVDAAWRRDRLLAAEAGRLAAAGAVAGPVIAAGSTGSMPATARLLGAVARLPRGAVVLPGLDSFLDGRAWASLTDEASPCPSHPQYGLARLLVTMRAERDEVIALAAPAPHRRDALLSEALRPAGSTEAWASIPQRLGGPALDAALSGVAVVEADDAREEALTIAVALREVLERADATAALITPDRDLARRVAAELLRFGIAIDDSAGEPLADTAAGRFARLVAEAAAQRLAPVPLMACLRHPAARFGLEPERLAADVDTLELLALRGPRPAPDAVGLCGAVSAFDPALLHRSDPRRALDTAARRRAADLAASIGAAFAPLLALSAGSHGFGDLIAGHRAVLEAAGMSEGADGDALAGAFEAMAAAAPYAPDLTLAAFAAALPVLLGDQTVRPPFDPDARLRILGPLEARLVTHDRVVLGGLVETVWPAATRTDPWLSRPMRAALGLDVPERRIGLSAHDFAQFCGTAEVVLTRPAKLGGAPTVPSRFLQRLAAVSGPQRWAAARARGDRLRRLAGRLDVEPPGQRIRRPAPAPALPLRPTQLSVTEIETWLRDPYSIYARHVLRLAPLPELDELPGGAERGSAIHDALGSFAATFSGALPGDALDRLIAAGREAFAPLANFPAEYALWWARFERLAAWYIAWERDRRPLADRIAVEVGGRLELPGTRGPFALTGRADRIERLKSGDLSIIDFKTGTVPTAKQTAALYSPQLPLEAAMARRGAFRAVPAAEAVDLVYVKLGGGRPPLVERSAVEKGWTAAALAERTLDQLVELVRAFESETQGYVALRRPMFRNRFGDYDHLARVGEWSIGTEGGNE